MIAEWYYTMLCHDCWMVYHERPCLLNGTMLWLLNGTIPWYAMIAWRYHTMVCHDCLMVTYHGMHWLLDGTIPWYAMIAWWYHTMVCHDWLMVPYHGMPWLLNGTIPWYAIIAWWYHTMICHDCLMVPYHDIPWLMNGTIPWYLSHVCWMAPYHVCQVGKAPCYAIWIRRNRRWALPTLVNTLWKLSQQTITVLLDRPTWILAQTECTHTCILYINIYREREVCILWANYK